MAGLEGIIALRKLPSILGASSSTGNTSVLGLRSGRILQIRPSTSGASTSTGNTSVLGLRTGTILQTQPSTSGASTSIGNTSVLGLRTGTILQTQPSTSGASTSTENTGNVPMTMPPNTIQCQQTTPAVDYSYQLERMRKLGLRDESLNLQALKQGNGNLQTAIGLAITSYINLGKLVKVEINQ
jgi:hypothetical protein